MSTEKIAHFITETSFEQLPIEAIDITKRAVLDCVGVTIAGIEEPGSRIVIEYVKEIGGTSEAGVIGTGYKAP
ncbi:MAG: MmgE/PrpD family protein, partial [Thermodesulfobacteriota bacterium]|nr:MmgE/PrpD family protein [Thermodesulfobacteriota bacterium]